MILIADSSALVALSICNSLTLLDQLFNEVLVPKAVYDECIRPNKAEADALREYLADKVCNVDMQHFVYLDAYADAGESEAMVLYKQKSADRLLIDDKRGRKVAKINNIDIIGSLGVLLSAKQHGLIREVKPRIQQIASSRIYLEQSLINMVLEMAEES